MNQRLVELFNILINNVKLAREFSKNNNINELYGFCTNIIDGYNLEEFTNFLRNVITINSKILNEVKEISSDELLNISGGFNFGELNRRALSFIMGGVLLFGSLPQAFANPNISNYDNLSDILVSQKVDINLNSNINDRIEEIKNNISETAKENLKVLAKTAERCIEVVLDTVTPSVSAVNVQQDRKKPTIYNWPKTSDIKLGDTVGSSSLSGGSASVAGKFMWLPNISNDTVVNVGKYGYICQFVPSDIEHYTKVTQVIYINVTPGKAKITSKPVASVINYGQKLSECILYGGTGNTPGKFSWEDSSIQPKAGTNNYNVIFTPNDRNYLPVKFSIPVKVNKATPSVITPASSTPIMYGDALKESKIVGLTMNVPGTIKWYNPSEKLNAGKYKKTLVFTPDDFKNYNLVKIDVDVIVNKAIARLDKRELNAKYRPGISLKDFRLPKGWRWKNSSIYFDKPGKFKFIAKYNADANHYETEEAITVIINKAEPSLSLREITYNENQHLSDIQLPKGWHWENENETPVASKSSYKASYNADEAGTICYHSRHNIDVKLNVIKADPKIEKWPTTVSDITYGDNLSQLKLQNGKSSVKGTFVISENRQLKVGKHECAIIFTPDNPNYQTKTEIIYVNIIKNMNPRQACVINSNQIYRNDTSIKFDTKEEDLEFSKDEGKTWQDSYEFKNLSPGTEYNFVYRYKDTESQCTGQTSPILKVSTKQSAPAAPQELKVHKRGRHEIEFESNNLLEFSKDKGKTWQDSSKFENLEGDEKYYFTARYKENEKHVAGQKSNIVQVKTLSWISNIINKIFGS